MKLFVVIVKFLGITYACMINSVSLAHDWILSPYGLIKCLTAF